MERIYILSHIYTSENNASFKNTNLSEMYPYSAGTEEAVYKELNRIIEDTKSEGHVEIKLTTY